MDFKSKLKGLGYASDPALSTYLDSLNGYLIMGDNVTQDKFKSLKDTREQLIQGHLKLVVKLSIDVFQFYSGKARAFDLMDLIQEGNETLLKCIDTYDFNRQAKFSTYLGNAVRTRLMNYISLNTGVMNLDKSAAMRELQYNRIEIQDMLDEGRDLEDIADVYGVQPSDIELVLQKHNFKNYNEGDVPDLYDELLDENCVGMCPVDDDGNYSDPMDGADTEHYQADQTTAEDHMIHHESMAALRDKIFYFKITLSHSDQYIFENVIFKSNRTQAEVADKLGITQQAVSKRIKNIMTKAQDYFDKSDLGMFS